MLNRGRRIVSLALMVAIPVLAAQVFLGKLLSDHPARAGLLAVALVSIVVMLTKPGAVLVTALPATYLYFRVGPASTDISLADVALAIALLAALPLVPWRASTMRSMLRVLWVYLLILAIPVAAVFSHRAVIEWGHRAFLVAGGILVGSAIAATGRTVAAVRTFLAASSVVAVAAIGDVAGHLARGDGFAPAYPFGIQKNAAGFLLVAALLTLIILPRMVVFNRPMIRRASMGLLLLGVTACQARGAALTLVVVTVLWAIQEDRVRLSVPTLIGGLLLVVITYAGVTAAFRSDQQTSQFNSVNSRISTYNASLDLWRRDPLVGVGLKYWRNPDFAGELAFGEPHDLVVSALGETGVIGVAALGVLVVATISVLRRGRSSLATFAALILVAKVVASSVDIFWVAGTFTLAWIVVGLACAPDTVFVDLHSLSDPATRPSRVR